MSGLLSHLVRGLGRFIGGLVYRVDRYGVERLPAGGVLLLPNHVTWVDAVVLQMACPRPIRFVMDAGIHANRWLNPVFRAAGVIPISAARAKAGIAAASEALRAGEDSRPGGKLPPNRSPQSEGGQAGSRGWATRPNS